MDDAILRPIAPPDRESKLALSAQAHALVPVNLHSAREKKKNKKGKNLLVGLNCYVHRASYAVCTKRYMFNIPPHIRWDGYIFYLIVFFCLLWEFSF